MRRACIVLAFCLAAFVAVASADTKNQTLTAFTSISASTPFNGMIALAADNKSYTLDATAPNDLLSRFTASVQNSALALSMSGSGGITITNQDANYTVRMPPNTLQSYKTSGVGHSDLQGAVLSTKSFSLTNSGTSSTTITNLLAPTLDVSSSGTGSVVVSGSPASVTITTNGTSAVYLSGVTGTVKATVSGIGSVYIISANSNVKISGSATSMGSVYYTQGSCSISSCRQQSISLPTDDDDSFPVNG